MLNPLTVTTNVLNKELNKRVSEQLSIVSNLKNNLNSAINSSTQITNSAINNTVQTANSIINQPIQATNSAINNTVQTANSAIQSVTGSTKKSIEQLKTQYYEREEKIASTSKYIQAIKPTSLGGIKKDASVLAKTPDAKIIEPQMKKDINEVKKLLDFPAGVLMGFLSSLIMTSLKTEIAEVKPTGEKSEYGKIQVKENKAGFVEISDETPGNVRKINLHPTGTYNSILDNGDTHDKVTGKKFTFVDKNWEIVVFENEIKVISGDQKVQIKKDTITTVNGNQDVTIDKNSNTLINQNQNTEVKKDDSYKVNGNQTINVAKDKKETVTGQLISNVNQNAIYTYSANKMETITGALMVNVTGPVILSSSAIVTVSAPLIMLG